ncbi:MAG: hypothetical protein KDA24_27430 [Deltaproteobacteria bacterium]|nr:hypothetical protein [Deltaproteobacteria bacterium]
MNILVSLLWLPLAPLVFGVAQAPSAWGIAALAVTLSAAGSLLVARSRPSLRPVAWACGALYAIASLGLVAQDALPGPGSRSATAPRDLQALPAPPGPDFIPHPNPVLHVLLTGERDLRPAWTTWSGGRGLAAHEGAIFVIDHPTYGLVIYEASSPFEVDVPGLLRSAGLDPDRVRTVVASDFRRGPGVAARSFPDTWVMADPEEPRPLGPGTERLHPVRHRDNPGFGPFGHYFDLAGDGSILLLAAPGPSPGHLALFLRLRWGTALLPGEVAPLHENLTTWTTPVTWNRAWPRQLGAVAWMQDNHDDDLVVLPAWAPRPLAPIERPDIVFHPVPSP